MNCGICRHWNLKDSPTRSVGFGLCNADPYPQFRAARTLSMQNICRIQRFEKADVKVIVRREKELASVL